MKWFLWGSSTVSKGRAKVAWKEVCLPKSEGFPRGELRLLGRRYAFQSPRAAWVLGGLRMLTSRLWRIIYIVFFRAEDHCALLGWAFIGLRTVVIGIFPCRITLLGDGKNC
ncbi:hypothetical protein Hdeb2414_s0017g00510601 [Helianthus debilis subsp. tardiflorus]